MLLGFVFTAKTLLGFLRLLGLRLPRPPPCALAPASSPPCADWHAPPWPLDLFAHPAKFPRHTCSSASATVSRIFDSLDNATI